MNPLMLVPRISEKAIALAEHGTYVFDVPASANKIEVGKAVAASFNVKVAAVNILIHKGKPTTKRYKGANGSRTNTKKAMVKLQPGQKIPLFEESK